MMDFDEIMGTPHMVAPAERCGRLLFAWFVAIEVLKVTINQIESQLGKPQTKWFKNRNGEKRFFSDNRVIERFKNSAKQRAINLGFPVIRASLSIFARLGKPAMILHTALARKSPNILMRTERRFSLEIR